VRARRLLFPAVGQVTWEEFESPVEPDPHSVVAESICSLVSAGTELAIYTGTHIGFTLPEPPFPLMPHRPGYAMGGEVTAVGREVSGLDLGQRVLMEAGHGTLAMADTRTHAVIPVPDGIPDAQAPLARMAGISFTALRLAPPQLGESAVILGLGLLGLLTGQLYRLAGARPVIGVDRLPARLSLADSFGIVPLDTTQQSLLGGVTQILGARGADIVVEATGNPTLVPMALDIAARGGRVVLLGSTRGVVSLDVYSQIHRKAVRLIGAHETALPFQSDREWSRFRDLRLALQLIAAGDLQTTGLITDHLGHDQALAAHEMLRAEPGAHLGVIIHWR
jgi:2-desacetyl-2-hydroxyethyl bacteriochlorophyllide A dehydrogenase